MLNNDYSLLENSNSLIQPLKSKDTTLTLQLHVIGYKAAVIDSLCHSILFLKTVPIK